MKKYQIIWSPLAEEIYLSTLSYILKNWSLKEAEDFENKVESLINRLKTHTHLCPASRIQKNLRRCVVTSQTSLIYQIKNDRIIELVAFFDNRSNHKY
jgi:plasmid stabilization system protein ParE